MENFHFMRIESLSGPDNRIEQRTLCVMQNTQATAPYAFKGKVKGKVKVKL